MTSAKIGRKNLPQQSLPSYFLTFLPFCLPLLPLSNLPPVPCPLPSYGETSLKSEFLIRRGVDAKFRVLGQHLPIPDRGVDPNSLKHSPYVPNGVTCF